MGKARGFAALKLTDPERMREIASRAGRAAHEKGTAHRFTSEEAREAGRKGGAAVASIPEHMRSLGRIGGLARVANRLANR